MQHGSSLPSQGIGSRLGNLLKDCSKIEHVF